MPTAEQLSDWRGSAGKWVGARLAEWDARNPSRGDRAFVVIDEPDPIVVREIKRATPADSPAEAPSAEMLAEALAPEPADDPLSPSVGELDSPAAEAREVGPDEAFDAAMTEVLVDFQDDRAAATLAEVPAVRAPNEPKAGESAQGLTRAVVLTREAVLAWARLLPSPAMVTLAD